MIAMGMAGLRGRMCSSPDAATSGARLPEKRCSEECRIESACEDRGREGRCVMGCQVAVRAVILDGGVVGFDGCGEVFAVSHVMWLVIGGSEPAESANPSRRAFNT